MLNLVNPNRCTDRVILDMWHSVGPIEEVPRRVATNTWLLGYRIGLLRDDDDRMTVWRVESDADTGGPPADTLPVRTDFGYIWACLGRPPAELFEIPEVFESGRLIHPCISIGMHTSAPRAIENFLDLAHFMTVHAGYLGEEPYTEIPDYDVEIVNGEVIASKCLAYQPRAAAGSTSGAMVEYVYRVPHPYCSVLYKTSPDPGGRDDIYAIFLQPMSDEWTRFHMFNCVVDTGLTRTEVRDFVQTIVSQDKPILENQLPKRLPLDPRADIPIRADKSAVAYRRWLTDLGVTYGVIRAQDSMP